MREPQGGRPIEIRTCLLGPPVITRTDDASRLFRNVLTFHHACFIAQYACLARGQSGGHPIIIEENGEFKVHKR